MNARYKKLEYALFKIDIDGYVEFIYKNCIIDEDKQSIYLNVYM